MRYFLNWQARAINGNTVTSWFKAEVPGNVQYDYGCFMGWGDINEGENVARFRQTEDYTWEYRTKLDFHCENGEKAVFVSEGIDYRFDILVNGVILISHEGMFSRVEADVTEHIGEELIVRIYPHPKNPEISFDNRDQANQCAKPPVGYGWDWHPRMLVSGIWQDTYVEVRGAGWISRCEPFYTLHDDFTLADIRFEVEADAPVEIMLYDPDGILVGCGNHITLDHPRLWWCNGQGQPSLYRYVACTPQHQVSGQIGFRTVELIMNEGGWNEPAHFPKGRSIYPIQLVLNGRRVFAKGSNWVNPDIYNGRIDEERYKALLTLARDAHMNILRCWGGAGIHKKAFYDLCDRLGIMVWAEFPLACNNYSSSPHYLSILEQEARAIIQNLRMHPSLVLYCGGNELFNNWSRMTDQSLPLRLLNKLCYELDRDRPFLATSPLYGMGHGGYMFYDSDRQMDVFSIFQHSKCTAYTEFGVPSLADMESLLRIIPANEQFPIRNEGSWKIHHAFEEWGGVCLDVLARYTQEPLDSLEKIVNISSWLQSEGYKAIFEEARRQAPYCSMAINWCYCEPWITAANNSLIIYPMKPKPSYYAVKAALRPVLASARIPKFSWRGGEIFQAQIWLLNDSPNEAEKTVTVIIHINGVEYKLLTWKSGIVAAGTNCVGPTINWVLPDMDVDSFTLCLSTQECATSEYRLCYLARQSNKNGAIKPRREA